MPYSTMMKSTYLSDLLRLDRNIQARANQAVKEITSNPLSPRGDTIKKLKHHDKLWRYRIDTYRLVYAVYPDHQTIQLIMIGLRNDIYDRLGHRPDDPDYTAYSEELESALDPDRETPARFADYSVRKQTAQRGSRTLPYRLSPDQLDAWSIPAQYHDLFKDCETEDDLLEVPAPQEILLHLMNCIWPPDVVGVTQSPNLRLTKTSDLDHYVEGDLIMFLLALDEDQEKVVDFGLAGPTLVKGGPGSGKSTVALYRIETLVRNNLNALLPIRILFTTYTNALISASQALMDRLLGDVDLAHCPVKLEVDTLDTIALRVASAGGDRPKLAEPGDVRYALTHARTAFKPEGNSDSEKAAIHRSITTLRDEYLQEEFDWVIEGRGLKTLDEYLATDRSGRGYAFDVRMRRAVWQLYQHSRDFIHQMKKITWNEMRILALDKLRTGQYTDKYAYVLVDEAQDLPPVAISLALELCERPAGLFMTADACQSLYNRGFAWKNVHESLNVAGRTRILKRNYRTTRQIAEAANSIYRQAGEVDEEVLDQFYVHTDRKPVLYEARDEADMFLWLGQALREACRDLHLPVGSAAILAPTNALAEYIADRLTSVGLQADYMQGKDVRLQSPHAKVMTIHSAKGLEFPVVAIPYLEEGILPRNLAEANAEELEKHLQQELRLFFVGCTRAMRRLLVTYRQNHQSRLLTDINYSLWDYRQFE